MNKPYTAGLMVTLCSHTPQLPVPLAVLFLMYRERLFPCCPSSSPSLMDKDELAMENQQGGPDTETPEVGGEGPA